MPVSATLPFHEEVKKHLQLFFADKLNITDLGQWAFKKYEVLLKGGYLYLHNLPAYSFVRSLSTIHNKPDEINDTYPCSIEEAKKIYSILQDKKDFSTLFTLTISPQLSTLFPQSPTFSNRNELAVLYDFLLQCQPFSKEFFLQEKSLPPLSAQGLLTEPPTVIDLLEKIIFKLYGMFQNTAEKSFLFENPCILYPSRALALPLSTCQHLLTYLAYALGHNPFTLIISYQKGIPSVDFL